MGYMTFGQQVTQHLQFLQKAGLEVKNLTINSAEFIRSRANEKLGRGEYAYKTVSRMLNNGMTGLMTWCRSENGQIHTYKTYGHSPDKDDYHKALASPTYQTMTKEEICLDIEKIQKFWELSSQQGESDYLKRKGVGAYRIRFRENQYGKVAVIPMRDMRNRLLGYQLLNPNGTKIFAKGIRISGLFHQLNELINGMPIGIAESYVTAATCIEIIGISMVTAFTSDNLEQIAIALRQGYSRSPLVMFADNDRHLHENKGIISAFKALKQAGSKGIVIAPYFNDYPRTRNYSDWNDLVREIGKRRAFEQIQYGLNNAEDEGLRQWWEARHSKNLAN
jgi:phage/plasmid primase-like uncharacterized protein